MQKSFRFILFYFLIVNSGLCFSAEKSADKQDEAPVKFELRLSKKSFQVEEEILVDLNIRNAEMYKMCYIDKWSLNSLKNAIIVTNPDGERLACRSEISSRYRKNSWLAISQPLLPKGVHQREIMCTINMNNFFTHARYQPGPNSFSQIGSYKIYLAPKVRVRYYSNNKEIIKEVTIKSNEVELEICKPDEKTLKQALFNLKNKKKKLSTRVSAINQLIYLPDNKFIDIVNYIFFDDKNKSLVYEALKLFNKSGMDATKKINIIKKVLNQFDDPLLRSVAIGALGEIGNIQSIKIIEKECLSKKPRSYIAAIQVLGKVGRKESIKVLKSVKAEVKNKAEKWVIKAIDNSIKMIKSP